MDSKQEQQFWTERYEAEKTGWDIGYPSTPIKEYIDQLTDKSIQILIPGAGNAYEAEYLWQQGFSNVHILDISEIPLKAFGDRLPNFPKDQLIQADFFSLEGTYDLIFEQTFFCSFVPTAKNRSRYVTQMSKLLKPTGKLVGLWFDIPLTGNMEKRPFGGDKTLYLSYLEKELAPISFEPCHNSIPPRMGNELFGIFRKK